MVGEFEKNTKKATVEEFELKKFPAVLFQERNNFQYMSLFSLSL